MVKRKSIEFIESKSQIREMVTKFGGQPVWLTQPQWPVSKATGDLMQFICQLSISPDMFGDVPCKMAYLFVTDEDEYVDETWEPDGGKNAVILQSGDVRVPVKEIQEGPTLYRMVKKVFRKRLVPEPCEFQVNLREAEDPDFVSEEVRIKWSKGECSEYFKSLDGNKMGGSPSFVQNDEFPGPGNWKLLLQLDASIVPFYLNFGDAGVSYVFLSEDGMTAKFLWQCT
jgi:uncharacterized protein YwqG